MAEATIRGTEKPADEFTAEDFGVVLAPKSYNVRSMADAKTGEQVIFATFHLESIPGKTPPKPITIVMSKQDGANIILDIAKDLEQGTEPPKATIITGE